MFLLSLTTRNNQTVNVLYVERNIEARSCKQCCSGKTIIIIYPECVFVALGTQHAMRMRRSVFCGLLGFPIFFHIIS